MKIASDSRHCDKCKELYEYIILECPATKGYIELLKKFCQSCISILAKQSKEDVKDSLPINPTKSDGNKFTKDELMKLVRDLQKKGKK